ncbi:MAG TPA: S1C family serine protease [Burkholderiales bacterium]|nr:S1C family serine protease [Burkholderiales bacterium]
MSDTQGWAFQESLQPKAEETQFDLARAFNAMVLVRVEVPTDAFSASTLGTERGGYGVVIRDDGLVLTIGYLINEASQIWLTTNRGQVVEGYPLAYDHTTGFGLIQPLGKLDAPHVPRGLAADVKVGDSAFVMGHGGAGHSLKTKIIDKREFAGRWEYVLDEALFTAPAHPQWGGAALLDAQGSLIGTGSLLIQQEVNGKSIHVNMFVPTDILEPILDAMLKTGRSPETPRPWLGMTTEEVDGKLVVARVSPGAPAHRAGVKAGDMVLSVGEQRATGLANLWRMVWQLGPAGVDVPLTVGRGGDVLRFTLKSADRGEFLWKPKLH